MKPLDPLDVRHRLPGREVLAIGTGERLAVPLEQRHRPLLAELLEERLAQVVRPRARRRGEPGLDLTDVVLRDRALLRVDDDVEASLDRLGDSRGVVDARPAERLLEDVLDPLPVLRAEALARQIDQAGEEALERVAADEQPHVPALAEVEDPERGREQLVLRDLEQLVTRVRLEDVEERLVVVAASEEAGALDHPLRLPPEHGDLRRAGAVGGVRVQPEEPPLARHLAGLVEPLDAHVVEVGGTVHRRPRVRLRQGERALLTGEPPHLRRQLRETDRDRPLVRGSQDAEARAGHRVQYVLPALGPDLVLAIAEEGEVTVVHPLEQVAGLRSLVGVDGSRRDLLGDVADALTHRRPVLHRSAHVAENAANAFAQKLERLGTGLAVDLDMDQRLGLPILGGHLEQPALLVPAEAHDRPDHEVDRAPHARHLHRDRVDEEGHVVDDGLDHGVVRLPPVFVKARRVDVHLHLAGTSNAREVPVRERRPEEVDVAPVAQVVGSDVRVVRANEPLDVRCLVGSPPARGRARPRPRGAPPSSHLASSPVRRPPSAFSSEYGLARLRGRGVRASRRRGATSDAP